MIELDEILKDQILIGGCDTDSRVGNGYRDFVLSRLLRPHPHFPFLGEF